MNKHTKKISAVILVCLAVIVTTGAIFSRSILAWYNNKYSPKVETVTQNPSSDKVVQDKNIGVDIPETQTPKTTTPLVVTPTIPPVTPPASTTRPTKSPINKEISQGNTSKKKVAITLDAGAGETQLPAILSILRQNNLHLTFFLTGKWAELYPADVKQIVAEGHTLGNHTYDHKDLTTLSDDQIRTEFSKTENIIKSIVPTSTTVPYFRPPYGSRNSHILQVAADSGYQSIYWTCDALDWMFGQNYQGKLVDNDFVKNRILDNIQNGSIVLMHVGDDITPAVLQDVITELQSRGYELVTIDELLK